MSKSSKHYIVAMRHTDMWLVGPFNTNDDAADYGASAQRAVWDDDPRWQTIELANTFGLRVDAPTPGLSSVGAYGRACEPA